MDDLWDDGLYLIEQGKAKLTRNSIHFSNSSYWQPIYNHSPSEGLKLHTQTHEDIVNSDINKKINESISACNPDGISTDSFLNSITSIRLFKSNFLNDLRKQNPDRLIISHLNVNSLRKNLNS